MSEETLCLQALGRNTITTEPKTAQNITFCPRELVDIEQIKPLLLEHYTQQQIAEKLGYTREAISRKIAKWMQTDDFREWSQTLWLKQYNQFSRTEEKEVEAFKALTKLICAQTTRRAEIKTESTENKTVTYNFNYSEEDKNAIINARRAINSKRSSPSEPISIH
jgi:DNA helicase IV